LNFFGHTMEFPKAQVCDSGEMIISIGFIMSIISVS
jgi:hypothetical protein